MITNINWIEIILSSISIFIVGILSLSIKNLLYNNKKPNGRKGGIVSFNISIAFSIITVIAIISQDLYVTGLTILLAYLISKEKIELRQHYLYQVILSSLIGITLPCGVFYFYYNKDKFGKQNNYEREVFYDMPEKGEDNRYEADQVPDLRLDDDE